MGRLCHLLSSNCREGGCPLEVFIVQFPFLFETRDTWNWGARNPEAEGFRTQTRTRYHQKPSLKALSGLRFDASAILHWACLLSLGSLSGFKGGTQGQPFVGHVSETQMKTWECGIMKEHTTKCQILRIFGAAPRPGLAGFSWCAERDSCCKLFAGKVQGLPGIRLGATENTTSVSVIWSTESSLLVGSGSSFHS